jgi:hypothetical protein
MVGSRHKLVISRRGGEDNHDGTGQGLFLLKFGDANDGSKELGTDVRRAAIASYLDE